MREKIQQKGFLQRMNISTLRQSAKDILISKKFYEYTFIFVLFTTFLIWLFKIFYEGHASSQFNVFFRGSADFFCRSAKCGRLFFPKGRLQQYHVYGVGRKSVPASHIRVFILLFPTGKHGHILSKRWFFEHVSWTKVSYHLSYFCHHNDDHGVRTYPHM